MAMPLAPLLQIAVLLASATTMGCGMGPDRLVNEGDSQRFGSDGSWDAGILLIGEEVSFVFPLDDPSVERADDIVAITTSCECTSAEVCEYWDYEGHRRVGIRVKMFDNPGQSSLSTASRLAVEIKIGIHAGKVLTRYVRVLLSSVAQAHGERLKPVRISAISPVFLRSVHW